VDSLLIILVFLFHPAHFLSAAKENGGKERRQGQAPAPHARKTQPLSASRFRASNSCSQGKTQNIRNSKSLLLAIITALERRRFFLPRIKNH